MTPYRFWAPRRLVKEVYGNLLLGWIRETFHCPVVYVLRHPCAVVASRLRAGWEQVDGFLGHYLSQRELVEDYLSPYVDDIRRATTTAAKLAVFWCVENLVPLSQVQKHGLIACSYEELVRAPDENFQALHARLGLPWAPAAARAIGKASFTTHRESSVRVGKDPTREWQNILTARDVQEVLDMTGKFGIDLYDESPWPRRSLLAAGDQSE